MLHLPNRLIIPVVHSVERTIGQGSESGSVNQSLCFFIIDHEKHVFFRHDVLLNGMMEERD